MTTYNIDGVSEMMLHHCVLNKKDFFNMSAQELKEFINEKIIEESFQIFVLTESFVDGAMKLEFKIGDGIEILSKVEYSEKNQLPAIQEDQIRLVFWEMLEDSNIEVDIPDNIKEITFKVEGNTYGCMDEWGNMAFEKYSFISKNKDLEIFFESESSGNVKEKIVYFLNSKGNCESISINENFEDELSEIKNNI